MKKNLFLFLSCFAILSASAQLVNNGAIIKIQAGAYIKCTGDVQNNSGTLTNDGRLEVQGNFTNTGTYNTTDGTTRDTLIMSGGAGGTVMLSPGGASFSNLNIIKTSAADIVKLGGTAIVVYKLDFTSGTFTTDPITNPTFLLQSPTSAVYNFAAGMEVVGRVKRTGWANGSPVVFNQPNMLVTTNGGVAPSDFTVLMIPQSAGGDPSLNEREVKRQFGFAKTGGSAYTTDIKLPYLVAELNTNTEANLVPWELIGGTEWNGRLTPVTRDGTNKWVSTTGIAVASLDSEWKLADPHYTMNATAYLRGPWNGSTMNTSVNSAGFIPLSQPYNTTPFNYTGTESVAGGFFGANPNIVDWVLVELRKPSATGLPQDALSSTIIGRKAGFLLNTGVAVDLDGTTPIAFDINKQGPSFMVIRHRNHLGVMSNSLPSNSTGSFANNFSILANSYKATGAPSNPVVLLAGSTYGLWAGDANKSGVVNGTDLSAVKLAIAASATGYLLTDANLSSVINGTDLSLVKLIISLSGTGSTPGRIINVDKVRTNIPDPVGE